MCCFWNWVNITYIMNLLDQLFQYSLRGDSSSISFSALDCGENLDLSSISHHSFAQSSVSPSLGINSITYDEGKSGAFCMNFEENIHSMAEKEMYARYKDKYRKLSKMVEMFSNKIRKIQYEFLVKLQNNYRSTFQFHANNHKKNEQIIKSMSFGEENQHKYLIFWDKVCHLYNSKLRLHLSIGFASISRKSMQKQKLDCFCCSLNSLIKYRKQLFLQNLFNLMKNKASRLIIYSANQLCIPSRKVTFKLQEPIFGSFEGQQNRSLKVPVVYHQLRETQNVNICDNLSLFLQLNQQLFQFKHEPPSLNCSALKNTSEIQFKTNKRKSDLTNVSGQVSQLEQCAKVLTQYVIDQKFEYQVPIFGLSQSALLKEKPEQIPFNSRRVSVQNISTFRQEELKNESSISHRFSLQDHQSELNRYITFRRSIQKKKASTLKQIEKSKEAIKKIVYQLQKSKNKNEKNKPKIPTNKQSSHKKSTQKKLPQTESKPCSPLRSKTIGIKTSRAQSQKRSKNKEDHKMSTSRDNPSFKEFTPNNDIRQFHTVTKNIEVYYNYMKAKKNSIKIDESSHKKQSTKCIKQDNPTKKKGTTKHLTAQNNLLVISKDPVLRERRIDVRVQFTKPSGNARLLLEKQKDNGKKSKK